MRSLVRVQLIPFLNIAELRIFIGISLLVITGGQQRDFFFASMAESVDAPDLKSVEHNARGSSSLPTRIP